MGANRRAKQDRIHRKKKKKNKKSKKFKHKVQKESRVVIPVINKNQTTGKIPDLIRETLAHTSREKIVQLLFQVKEKTEHCYDFDISFWLQKFMDLGGDVNLIEAAYLIVNAGHIYERKVDLVYELVRRSAESAREASEGDAKKQQAPPKIRRKITRQAVSVHDRLYESEMLTKQFKQMTYERITELFSSACHKAPSHSFKKWAAYKLWRQSHKKKMRNPVPYSTVCDDLYLHPAMWGLSCVEDFDYDDDLDTKRNYRMFTHQMEHRYNTIVPDINFLMHFKVKDYIEAEEDEIEMKRILDLPTPPSRQWPPYCKTSYSKELAKEAFNIDIGESAEDYVKKYVDLEDIVLEKQSYEIDNDLLQNAREAQKTKRSVITCKESAQQIIFEELKKIMMAKTLKKDPPKENGTTSKENTDNANDVTVNISDQTQNKMLVENLEAGGNNVIICEENKAIFGSEHEYEDMIEVMPESIEEKETVGKDRNCEVALEEEQFTLVEVVDDPSTGAYAPITETFGLNTDSQAVVSCSPSGEYEKIADNIVDRIAADLVKAIKSNSPVNLNPNSPKPKSEGRDSPTPNVIIESVQVLQPLNIESAAIKQPDDVEPSKSGEFTTRLENVPHQDNLETVENIEGINLEIPTQLEASKNNETDFNPESEPPLIGRDLSSGKNIENNIDMPLLAGEPLTESCDTIRNVDSMPGESIDASVTSMNKDASSIISDSIRNNISDHIVIRVSIDEGIAFSELDDLDKAMLSPVVELVDIFNPMKQGLKVCRESKMIVKGEGFQNFLGIDERYLTYQADFQLPLEYIYKQPELKINLLQLPENRLRRKVHFALTSDFEIYMVNRLKRKCSDRNDYGPTRMIKVFRLNDMNIKNIHITPPTTPNREDDFLGFEDLEISSFEDLLSSTLISESNFSRLLSSTTNRSISRDSGIGLSSISDSQLLNSTVSECEERILSSSKTEANTPISNKSHEEASPCVSNFTLKDATEPTIPDDHLEVDSITKSLDHSTTYGEEMIEILEHWGEDGERPSTSCPKSPNTTKFGLQTMTQQQTSGPDAFSQIKLNTETESESHEIAAMTNPSTEDVVMMESNSNINVEDMQSSILPSELFSQDELQAETFKSSNQIERVINDDSLPNEFNETSLSKNNNCSLKDCNNIDGQQNLEGNRKKTLKKSSLEENVDFEQNLYEKCANNDKIEKRVSEMNQMTERIQRWHRYLRPILAKSMERHHFDIFAIGTDIIQTFPETGVPANSAPVISLENVMENRDPTFLSRYFLSMLQLANAGNVEIQVNKRDINKPTSLGEVRLKLLSRKRHTVAAEDNIGARLLPTRKRQHSASDDSDSLSESDLPLRDVQYHKSRGSASMTSPTCSKLLKRQPDDPVRVLNGQQTLQINKTPSSASVCYDNVLTNRTSTPKAMHTNDALVRETFDVPRAFATSSSPIYHQTDVRTNTVKNSSLHGVEKSASSIYVNKNSTVSNNAIISIYKKKSDNIASSSQNSSSNNLSNSSENQEMLSSTITESQRFFSRELPPFNTIRRFDKSSKSPQNKQESYGNCSGQTDMFASVAPFNVPSTSNPLSLLKERARSSVPVNPTLIRTQESMFGGKQSEVGNDDLDSGIFSEFSLTENNSMLRDS